MADGEGAAFDTRDPVSCESTIEPASGPITEEMALLYTQCASEGVSGDLLFLVDQLKVQVGQGVPFGDLSPNARPGNSPDTSGLVYAIRGSFIEYVCTKPSDILETRGKNCITYDNSHAKGECYRTSFGDWACRLMDLNATATYDQPPLK